MIMRKIYSVFLSLLFLLPVLAVPPQVRAWSGYRKRVELKNTWNSDEHIGYVYPSQEGGNLVLDYDFDNPAACHVSRIIAETRDSGSKTDISLNGSKPEYTEGSSYVTGRDAVLYLPFTPDAVNTSHFRTRIWFDCGGRSLSASVYTPRTAGNPYGFVAYTAWRNTDDCEIQKKY